MSINTKHTIGGIHAGLKAEREGLIIAAKNQSLDTRSYHCHITKDKTTDHIFAGYPELANEFTYGHNRVATYVQGKICKKHIETTERGYEHQPDTVTQNNDGTISWDIPIKYGKGNKRQGSLSLLI